MWGSSERFRLNIFRLEYMYVRETITKKVSEMGRDEHVLRPAYGRSCGTLSGSRCWCTKSRVHPRAAGEPLCGCVAAAPHTHTHQPYRAQPSQRQSSSTSHTSKFLVCEYSPKSPDNSINTTRQQQPTNKPTTNDKRHPLGRQKNHRKNGQHVCTPPSCPLDRSIMASARWACHSFFPSGENPLASQLDSAFSRSLRRFC